MSKDQDGIIKNFLWKFAESAAPQVVSLVVSVILARLLAPSDYGTVAVVTVFITLANVFVNDGLGSALIQKKNADALDFSSVLYANVVLSILLYVAVFFCAPFVADFYGEEYVDLCMVIRILGLRIVLVGFNSVQQAYISKKMQFKKLFGATLTATVISAAAGVGMAYSGYGVWALVAQNLLSALISTVYLFFSIHKLPLLKISFSRLKGLLDYGFKILGANLLITGYQELRGIIIGKVYSANDLAYYDRGKQFPQLVVTNVNTSLSAVLFPKMSKEQDDRAKVLRITRYSVRLCAFIMCPVLLGLAAVAEPFVAAVLTEKWMHCVPILQLFCIIYLFQPIHTANTQAIKALGRSDIYLKLESVKKAIELISLVAVAWISVEAIVIAMAVTTTLVTAVNAYPNRKLLGYGFGTQLKDVASPVLMSLGMVAVVILESFLPLQSLPLLCVQVASGAIVYLALAVITKNPEMRMLLSKLRRKNK